MALTAKTTGGNKEGEISGIRVRIRNIGLDSSYPTGGYPLVGAFFGMGNLHGLITLGWNTSGQGYVAQYNATTKKLMIFTVSATGTVSAHSHPLTLKNAAVADGATTRANAGTNLFGANTGSDITVAGGGANGGVQNATPTFTGTATALVEVLNATDLSLLVITLMAIGY